MRESAVDRRLIDDGKSTVRTSATPPTARTHTSRVETQRRSCKHAGLASSPAQQLQALHATSLQQCYTNGYISDVCVCVCVRATRHDPRKRAARARHMSSGVRPTRRLAGHKQSDHAADLWALPESIRQLTRQSRRLLTGSEVSFSAALGTKACSVSIN